MRLIDSTHWVRWLFAILRRRSEHLRQNKTWGFLQLEQFEDRALPTTNLYLDFGDGFLGTHGLTTDGNNVEVDDLVNRVSGPSFVEFRDNNGDVHNSGITGSSVLAFTSFTHWATTTREEEGGGQDLYDSQANGTADTGVIFVNHLFSFINSSLPNNAATAIAYTTAHEAGHTFGLRHTDNETVGNVNFLLTGSDIISKFSRAEQAKRLNVFSRFDLATAPSEQWNPSTENPYEVLKSSIGLALNRPVRTLASCSEPQTRITDRTRTFSEAEFGQVAICCEETAC
jgi:hypothetical protein